MKQKHAADAFEGWVSVSLLLLPCLPLWLFWEELVRWSGGYSETVVGFMIFAQTASLLLLKDPLIRSLVMLSQKLDLQPEKSLLHNDTKGKPVREGGLHSLRVLPDKRFHEMAGLGILLAKLDAEQNLLTRTLQLRNKQTEMPRQHTNTTVQENSADHGDRWTVYVDDNFHHMDEDERYVLVSFDNFDAALAACRKVVDECLASITSKSADELYKSYCMFGDDPWIAGPPATAEQPHFSARDYARLRCSEIHNKR